MPLSKEEAIKRNAELYNDEYQQMCAEIDEKLKEWFPGKHVSIHFRNLHGQVIARIIAAYKELGWTITHNNSQMDGDSFQLK